MKKVYIVIILSALSFLSFCKGKKSKFNYQPDHIANKEVIKIADEMSSSLEDSYVGAAGSKSAQYTQFEELMKISKEAELIELTNHPNPAVRCYSFLGLTQIKSKEIKNILHTHIKDHEKISFTQGCIIMSYTVIQFMIGSITNAQEDGKHDLLSKEELDFFKKKANIK